MKVNRDILDKAHKSMGFLPMMSFTAAPWWTLGRNGNYNGPRRKMHKANARRQAGRKVMPR